MAQFTSSGTADPSGAVVNAVLNTDTNTITYTVTTSSGLTATTTAPTSEEGNSVRILNAIRGQITAQTGDILATARALNGFGDQLNNVQVETTNQAATTPGTVQESKPIPTNNQADPAVPPAVNNTPVVESPSPPAAVPTSSDPAQQQQAAIVNADITAPAQVSPFNDPAQRATVADQVAIEQAQNISTFQDPAQRGQAQIEAIQNSAPAANPMGQDPAQRAEAAAIAAAEIPAANPQGQDPAQRAQGLTTAKLDTASQATQQDASNFKAKEDWRVRLSLAPGANYLYKAKPPGILAPLVATDGVIFPYTPDISVSYVANYDPTELTHSNYKFFTYRGSAVDSITIGCEFTAQDTFEAQYVLAVIHFFRSITKMFYGQDNGPANGTPPPLCYLSGLGAFQFDACLLYTSPSPRD